MGTDNRFSKILTGEIICWDEYDEIPGISNKFYFFFGIVYAE